MFKKSLGLNSWGVERVFHFDPYTNESHIEYKQDAEAHVEYSKKLQNDEEYTRKGMKDSILHYAHIPPIVQLKWINEYGVGNDPMLPQNEKLLFRILNSREYRHLKTTNKIHIPAGSKTV